MPAELTPPQRFAEEFRIIAEALGPARLAPGITGTGAGDPLCVIQRGTLLMSADDADWIRATDNRFRRRFPLTAENQDRTERSGLVRLALSHSADDDQRGDDYKTPDEDVADALSILREFEVQGVRAITASPNHVVGITGGIICPADEPWPTADPRSISGATQAPPDHRRPRVLVVDTGLIQHYADLMLGDGITGNECKPEVIVDADGHATPYIREYVGHGTFITGLLKAVAPTADVYVSNALPNLGAAFEDEFGESLFTAVGAFQSGLPAEERHEWPDIISLSAGTTLYYDPHHPQPHERGLLALKVFMDELRRRQTLLVAAAGNNGSSTRIYPAALSDRQEFSEAVVSVGALREDPGDGRACFSDFGPWVKAYAPGERLVSGFSAPPGRKLQYQHATLVDCQFLPKQDSYLCTCRRPKHGGALTQQLALGAGDVAYFGEQTHDARWSGTSFSTPIVAGYIAQRMAHENRDNARDVYADMLKAGDTIEVAGETALRVVPDSFTVNKMVLPPEPPA